MPFQKGHKPFNRGRPKGSKSKATTEMGLWARSVFESAAYREAAEARIVGGTATAIEIYWLQRIYGKPVEKHEHEAGESLLPLIKNLFATSAPSHDRTS